MPTASVGMAPGFMRICATAGRGFMGKTMRKRFSTLLCLLICFAASRAAAAAEPAGVPALPWFSKAPPLPKPAGQVVRVASVEELFKVAGEIKPGGTILVADGHYLVPRTLDLHTDNITLRGASGDRQKVVLDGARSQHGELVAVTGCSGVTIADLCIQNIKYNGFKINSDRKAHRVTIYNCIVHNIWQRGVKGPGVPEKDQDQLSPRDCRIQFCLFHNDRPKQFADDPTDTANSFGGNYVGGIDAMQCRAWTISDNVFVGIRGRTGEARGAVFLWMDSRDCIVERNIIIHCDTGICLGNSHRARFPIHCTNCIVRNNFITGAPENGILADYTRDCKILHNTIHDPASRLQRLIRLVHANEGLVVANNLLSGPPMRIETESRFQSRGNVENDLSKFFANAAEGNLHLKEKVPGVTGAAPRLPEAPEDIDRRRRSDPTDVGAQQQQEATPP